jgi:hypothetical protein
MPYQLFLKIINCYNKAKQGFEQNSFAKFYVFMLLFKCIYMKINIYVCFLVFIYVFVVAIMKMYDILKWSSIGFIYNNWKPIKEWRNSL